MLKTNPMTIKLESAPGGLVIHITVRLTNAQARHAAELLWSQATAAQDPPKRTPRKPHARS
jgi:hypothetical protein